MNLTWDPSLNPFYFVIARDTGNVIRLIHRNSTPVNTSTVIHRCALAAFRRRYEAFSQAGEGLIHVSRVLDDFAGSELKAD